MLSWPHWACGDKWQGGGERTLGEPPGQLVSLGEQSREERSFTRTVDVSSSGLPHCRGPSPTLWDTQ